MRRLVLPETNLQQSIISITDDVAHYLCHVLRLKPGDELLVGDGRGQWATVALAENGLKVIDVSGAAKKSSTRWILAVAPPKGGRMDWVVEKGTELGMDGLIPMVCERSVVDHAGPQKLERWKRLARQATQQCGRSALPEIFETRKLSEVLAVTPKTGAVALFHPHWADAALNDFAAGLPATGDCTLLFGPEGGFSAREVAAAQQQGAVILSLGSNVLRAETAPCAALAILRHLHGGH